MMMANIRRWHSYIGMFIAPSVLFFSVTGALQLFSLHESHGTYDPPALIEKLSSVHKDQVFAFGHHHRTPTASKPAGAESPPPPDDDERIDLQPLLLKMFFLLVAVGLACSTLFGLWIGLTRPFGKATGWGLLAAGAAIPVVLAIV